MNYRLFAFILLLPFFAHGKSLTANLLTSEKQIKVVRSFTDSKYGIIKTPLCYGCQPSELKVTKNTQLMLKGIGANLEDILKLTLTHKSNDIRIQY